MRYEYTSKVSGQERTLIIFDMDGVLTQHSSSWQYVHDRIGVNNRENYELFKNREISYETFLESDVRLWNRKLGRIRREDIVNILNTIPLRDNLRESMETLRGYGSTLAIISGGISWLSDRINGTFHFDFTYVNYLNTDSEGIIQPKGVAVVDPLRKDLAVRKLQKELKISSERTVSVGDSIHDVPMFNNSAFSVGFNPTEEEVGRHATATLQSNDLQALAGLIVKAYLDMT